MDQSVDLAFVQPRQGGAVEHLIECVEAFDRGIDGGKGIVAAEEELVPDAVFLNQHQAVVELEGAVV